MTAEHVDQHSDSLHGRQGAYNVDAPDACVHGRNVDRPDGPVE